MTRDQADIVAIEQLIAAFNHCVDFGDGDRFAGLFLEDGVLDMGHTRIEGSDALRHFAAGVPDRVPHPRHVVTNVWVEPAGDEATARSYAQVFVSEPGAGRTLKNSGRYLDRLARTPAGWRFRERRYLLDG